MSEKTDVIIVGGGIMGTASAFFLRRHGLSVRLLERGLVGQQASGVNFGNVRGSGRFIPQLPLSTRAREIWGRLGDLIGTDCEFIPSGRIQIAYTEDRLAVLEEYARKSAPYGLQLEILGSNALRERFPFLSEKAVGGSWAPFDGHANPRLVSPAFAKAAQASGAVVQENTEVTAIEKTGGMFAVTVAGGRVYEAPQLLITAGAWASRLSAQVGEPVPLVTRGPQMAVTEPTRYFMRPAIGISTADPLQMVYIRQVERGNVVIGGGLRGPASADTMRAYVDPANTLNQIRQASAMIPALANLSVIRTWSGIESYLPDDIPVMGPSGKVDGLFYAFGFCGHGFQIGPGVGDVMAELIATGSTTTPIEPFHIDRFADGTLAWKTLPT